MYQTRQRRVILLSIVWLFSVIPARGQSLPEHVSQELRERFFMEDAAALLVARPVLEDARRGMENGAYPVQYMGAQARETEVTVGYVSTVPETFVSVTLYFDIETDRLDSLHVVLSPGMWSRAESFVESGVPINVAASEARSRRYLLGRERHEDVEIEVTLSQAESELGTIYSINYAAMD